MKVIKGLIKKDLYNLTEYKQTILVMLLLMFIIKLFSDNVVQYMPIIIITAFGMLILSIFSYDEQSKSENYILTFPTNRKEIIKAKYILIIGTLVVSGLIAFCTGIVLTLLTNTVNVFDCRSILIITMSGIFGVALIQSIQIPSIYKWGAEKGRVQMFLLFFLIIAIVVGLITLVWNNTNINFNIEEFFNKYGLLLLSLSVILMYYISYKIACKIYINK